MYREAYAAELAFPQRPARLGATRERIGSTRIAPHERTKSLASIIGSSAAGASRNANLTMGWRSALRRLQTLV